MGVRKRNEKEIFGIVLAPSMIPRSESFKGGKNVTTEKFTSTKSVKIILFNFLCQKY